VLRLVVVGHEQLLTVKVLRRCLTKVGRTARELVKQVLLVQVLAGAVGPNVGDLGQRL
jgi:hypothetical protein